MRKNNLIFSFKLLKEAVNEFKFLLNSQQELDEKKDLQPFFRKYPILLLVIADLGGISKTNVDELEFEFDLWQGLICDFGMGNSKTNTYCLVELEDTKSKSDEREGGEEDGAPYFYCLEVGHTFFGCKYTCETVYLNKRKVFEPTLEHPLSIKLKNNEIRR